MSSKDEKVINDPVRNLEDTTIHTFDEEYWIKKARILKKILDDEKIRKEILGEEKKIGFLLFELFSTKIHCCETLLRILVLTKKGYFRPLIPLIQLDHRKFNSEVKKMQENPDEYFEDQEKFFKNNFYPYPELEKEKEKIDISIKFLKKVLPLIISEYANRGAYNVFKHGYYGSTSSGNTLTIDEDTIVGKAPNMISWYEINEFKDHHQLHQISKAISPERELNITSICSSMLAQLFKVKRDQLNKSTKVKISFFSDVDLDKVFSVYSYDTTLDNLKFSYEICLPDNFP